MHLEGYTEPTLKRLKILYLLVRIYFEPISFLTVGLWPRRFGLDARLRFVLDDRCFEIVSKTSAPNYVEILQAI